jgi:hypothetical protein
MKQLKLLSVLILLVVGRNAASAQTTAFTYQGKLTDGGNAAHAAYDMQFKLFDAEVNGNQIGLTVTRPAVQVANGIFTVRLDFGGSFDGSDRWLEIAVRPAGGPNFTTLTPRQQFTSDPHSLQAANATDAARLGGVLANQYVLTGDARLSDARPPTPGSNNYIQNSELAPQTASFNVTGHGTVGGQFRANLVIAAISFGLNNTTVFHKGGVDNIFIGANNAFFFGQNGSNNVVVGDNTGQNFADPTNNSFFGTRAGQQVTTGSNNSFFGFRAGHATNVSAQNSFFGAQAGEANAAGNNSFFGYRAGYLTTTGDGNSFFGQEAGRLNSTGRFNVFIGANSGLGNTTGSNNTLLGEGTRTDGPGYTFATAIGSGAVAPASNTVTLGRNLDTVLVPGGMNVQGSFFANGANLSNLNAFSINTGVLGTAFGGTGLNLAGASGNFLRSNGIGWTSSALQLSDIPDLSANYIRNSNLPQAMSNFNISGNGIVGGNLGIGTNAPNSSLHLSVNSGNILLGNAGCSPGFNGLGFGANLSGCTNYSLLGNGTDTIINRPQGGSIYFRADNLDQMVLDPTGKVKLGVIGSGGATQLCRDANLFITTCGSSLRYKKDLQPFTGGLSVINRLRPVTFRWKADNLLDLGFAAEDVAEIEPLLATYNDKGNVEGVKYDRLSAVFVNALKEQQAQIQQQQNTIANLQQQVEALKNLVCADHPQAAVCRQP